MNPAILTTKSLSKSFPQANGVLEAIHDIQIAIKQGEFLCVVGPSGCGKTTLLHLLSGLESPTSGEVRLNDTPLLKPHPDVSVVFQKPNLMPWRTVLENIMLPLTIQNHSKSVAIKKAEEILFRVGLSEFSASYPNALSGGMEQRVAVARALVQEPKILMLDEPFSALDELTREKLNLELLDLWRHQNITALMVTHNIREAVLMADRILVLSPRPSKISAEFKVNLPRPRHQKIEYTPEFVDLSYRVRQSIED